MIEIVARVIPWVGLLIGVGIIWFTWSSIIVTVIVPRNVASSITSITWRIVEGGFHLLVNRQSQYERKDRLLALLGPVALLATLTIWMLLFLVGFALIFWPMVNGGLGAALRLAGSSFFTLGFSTAEDSLPTALEFAAAASGTIVIALQIGYLPTIYSAYNRREALVTALSSRAGVPAWGPELLARHQLVGGTSTLPTLFAAWESWAADINESHVSYPWLMAFRSPNPLYSWVTSALAVLDAAALYLAVAPSRAPAEAIHCLRAGYVMLRALAHVAGQEVDDDPRPDAPLDLAFAQFALGVEHLRQAQFPVERSAEEAWRDFRGWRVNYEAAAYALADYIVAAPTPWSGRRSGMTRQTAFDVMSNRPRHRTPDDPDGLGGLTWLREAAPAASPADDAPKPP